MEIFGGFMVMMSILSFFMAIVWLVMPFVVFTIKGKLDRTLDVLDGVEKRLSGIESRLSELQNELRNGRALSATDPAGPSNASREVSDTSVPLD